jgi:transketolase
MLDSQIKNSKTRCYNYRKKLLDISQKVISVHIGGSFSSFEIMDLVFFNLKKKKDKFVLSKGHAAIGLYIILNKIGLIKNKDLQLYSSKNGILGVHPDFGNPGIEASTGSLGHGLGLSAGIAHGLKVEKKKSKVYVLISDGELQEGSTWEALMMISNLKLDNIICFLDHNGSQSFGITKKYHPNFYPIKDKIKSFGWECYNCNGHDVNEIEKCIKKKKSKKPLMIIANTTKGMGVDFMENDPVWHYKHLTNEMYLKAIDKLRIV